MKAVSSSSLYAGVPELQCPAQTNTTTMAVEFDEGAVIGIGLPSTLMTDRLTRVSDYILCSRSGDAAGTQVIADMVACQLGLHQVQLGAEEKPTVCTAAQLFRSICYTKRQLFSAGFLVAGFDDGLGGQVYSIPPGGALFHEPWALGGDFGYIQGYGDANYKPGMNKQQATELVTNALSIAISCHGQRGGVVRLGIITKNGVEEKAIHGNQLPMFHTVDYF